MAKHQVPVIAPGSIIGIIGGGQLGRMTALAAANLGYRTHIFTPDKASPAEQVSHRVTIAPYRDKEALQDFAKSVDVVTFEFENIPFETLKMLEKQVIVHPNPEVLHVSQNRLREKDMVAACGIGTTPYRAVHNLMTLKRAVKELGTPCILKTVEMGYDGKGQFVITADTDLKALWEEIAIGTGILEAFVKFDKEISVIVARNGKGDTAAYPPVENIHKNGILDKTIAPAAIDVVLATKATNYAHTIAKQLNLIGILAVEFFVTKNGDIWVNEIAPRPHNSGHWTMDACVTSQFEQFVRAVCGLPLGSVDVLAPAIMQNLIGDDAHDWWKHLEDPLAKLHLYGKATARAGRKMGHVTRLQFFGKYTVKALSRPKSRGISHE